MGIAVEVIVRLRDTEARGGDFPVAVRSMAWAHVWNDADLDMTIEPPSWSAWLRAFGWLRFLESEIQAAVEQLENIERDKGEIPRRDL